MTAFHTIALAVLGWAGNAALWAGVWGIGNKKRSAFLVALLGEILWIIKGGMLGMWDLIVACIIFSVLDVVAWLKWGKK